MAKRRKTTRDLRKQYEAGQPITMVTCYDYTFARLVDKAELDCILVGDSLGNVIQGHETTIPVTVDDIVYHTRAVTRGCPSAHIVADMPFMSYQSSADDGLRAAGRLLKEGNAQSVKVEGGEQLAPMIDRMVRAGIPVVGHLGLTPQSVHAFGGFRVQAKSDDAAERLLADARALQDAGAFMLVLEMIPADLAKRVTEEISIPTIGIGAGVHTSGQVLVIYDLLGLNLDFTPRFLKHYARLEETVTEALSEYRDEVRERRYPTDDHSF
jgi:3-methyl-2-oxobutanoate hydroxymethyltransferase